jgi:N6-L-threonylcarbamoyladenine synthase
MTEKQDTINILAIESSCDDTAAAVIQNGKILANIVSSQLIHQQYGGVIPELASRAHQQNIVKVISKALEKAEMSTDQLHAVAYTQGPGLMGSLLVGSQFAKGLCLASNLPSIGVNHLEAHVAAHYIEQQQRFPMICLLVSGGHTQLILVKSELDMSVLGSTLDDAAGEAFDKTAKLLNLPYPGGPLIDQYAELGNDKAFEFPVAKLEDYQFSYSGLKTALLYFLQKQTDPSAFIEKHLNDICASMRKAIVKPLIRQLEKAALAHNVQTIAIAGGVSANALLRRSVIALGEKHQWRTLIPAFEYCTDNAAMIAMVAHYKYLNQDFTPLNALPFSRMD